MYSDGIRTLKLPGLQIRRVSNVEFNHTTGLWEARDRRGRLVCKNASRQACIEQEVKTFTKKLNDVRFIKDLFRAAS